MDEHGDTCDVREFSPYSTRYCACGNDLGGYQETGTPCEDCREELEADRRNDMNEQRKTMLEMRGKR
jgi:hypothetical protein